MDELIAFLKSRGHGDFKTVASSDGRPSAVKFTCDSGVYCILVLHDDGSLTEVVDGAKPNIHQSVSHFKSWHDDT